MAFVASDEALLYVRELGEGTPVIVVHGGPDFDHEYFLPELDGLADGLRLVYYDQRGRGRSFQQDRRTDVTIESEVADLDVVRRTIGGERVAVLGHSWGVVVALEYALRHPAGLSHLILMNSAPVSSADAAHLRNELARRRTAEETRTMGQLLASPELRAGAIEADAAYYRIHFRGALHRDEVLPDLIGRLRVAFSPAGIVRATEIEHALYEQTWSSSGYDLTPHLRALSIPTLVIHGTSDIVPLSIAEHIASSMPDAELVVLADCGHFAFIDQPDEVRRLVMHFLRPRH